MRAGNDAPVRADGRYVVYWMIAARRTRHNVALDHALQRCRELGRPLLVFEPLRVGYRWASVRLHTFAIEGMRDNAARCARAGVRYLPYVEPTPGAGKGLLRALAEEACLVVTDDTPTFFLPRMVAAAARGLPVRLELVDGVGVLPLSAHGRAFSRAVDFRRHLHRRVVEALDDPPEPEPLRDHDLGRAEVPPSVTRRWPEADVDELLRGGIERLPIDRAVGKAPLVGGSVAGEAQLASFLGDRLSRYLDRNHPDADAASGLSPWLHWGHVGAVEVARAVLARDGWTPSTVRAAHAGRREGFWGASPEVEALLDELITWRELGHGDALHRPGVHATYAGTPAWAVETLGAHAADPRPHRYDLDALTAARTADRVWNAAQRQLLEEGRIHNYLRMLWGKAVLAWTPRPEEAFDVLVTLNDRFALDGRDPNSHSGIGWVFGRFDRAWGPERPIYGKVRYMSSEATLRKLRLRAWLARFGEAGGPAADGA